MQDHATHMICVDFIGVRMFPKIPLLAPYWLRLCRLTVRWPGCYQCRLRAAGGRLLEQRHQMHQSLHFTGGANRKYVALSIR